MCRVVAYLGEPLFLDVLLFRSDSSLVMQANDPRLLGLANLAGWGVAAWSPDYPEPDEPFLYRDPGLPMYDDNLRRFARKIRGRCILAHVRGSATNARTELHPYLYEGAAVTMAHNGTLSHFGKMRFDLLEHIRPEVARHIRSACDSEWIYAVLLSQLPDPSARATVEELAAATHRTLEILRAARERQGIETASAANLFVTDGRSVVTTRFAFDFGCYEGTVGDLDLHFQSLWYTAGCDYGLHDEAWRMVDTAATPDSILLASEPLTRDMSLWVEVPEYTLMTATRTDGRLELTAHDLDL